MSVVLIRRSWFALLKSYRLLLGVLCILDLHLVFFFVSYVMVAFFVKLVN